MYWFHLSLNWNCECLTEICMKWFKRHSICLLANFQIFERKIQTDINIFLRSVCVNSSSKSFYFDWKDPFEKLVYYCTVTLVQNDQKIPIYVYEYCNIMYIHQMDINERPFLWFVWCPVCVKGQLNMYISSCNINGTLEWENMQVKEVD